MIGINTVLDFRVKIFSRNALWVQSELGSDYSIDLWRSLCCVIWLFKWSEIIRKVSWSSSCWNSAILLPKKWKRCWFTNMLNRHNFKVSLSTKMYLNHFKGGHRSNEFPNLTLHWKEYNRENVKRRPSPKKREVLVHTRIATRGL